MLARRSDCFDDDESCENEEEPCEIGGSSSSGGLQLQGSGEYGEDTLDALERLFRASPDFPDHFETLHTQTEQLEKLWNLPDAEGYHFRENIVATSDPDFRRTSSSEVLHGLERSVSLNHLSLRCGPKSGCTSFDSITDRQSYLLCTLVSRIQDFECI
jgi:hypothetical protein